MVGNKRELYTCDSVKQEKKKKKGKEKQNKNKGKRGNYKREIDRAKEEEEEEIGMGRRLAAEEISVRGSVLQFFFFGVAQAMSQPCPSFFTQKKKKI